MDLESTKMRGDQMLDDIVSAMMELDQNNVKTNFDARYILMASVTELASLYIIVIQYNVYKYLIFLNLYIVTSQMTYRNIKAL